ncbi:Rieske (2Fe-2S) protein [Cellulomonas sp. URHE0023]|uniref:Rieske (2Fe-2S) protein n=1 Tax=Cellulomonas sp. URHE0023 TaxID=1380354 RepID=UPI00054E1315|nr:Rieske (2Fe-2S) protein [Cellulomonas sp. URHE0023]
MEAASRREVLEGAGVLVVAGVVGFAGFQAVAPAEGTGPSAYPGTTDDQGDDNGGGDDSSGPGSAQARLAPLSDVPDGGGLVVTDQKVVITRTGSDVHAFTAVCTHQGCLVRDVRGGAIHCPCHGSAFDATTGAVVQGPATAPLDAVDVVVRDGEVVRT